MPLASILYWGPELSKLTLLEADTPNTPLRADSVGFAPALLNKKGTALAVPCRMPAVNAGSDP